MVHAVFWGSNCEGRYLRPEHGHSRSSGGYAFEDSDRGHEYVTWYIRAACLLTVGLVWAHGQADPARGWLVSRTLTLICHLWDCELQPRSVRDQALLETSLTSLARVWQASGLAHGIPVPLIPWPITAEASGSRSLTHTPFQLATTLSVGPYSHPMYPPSASTSFLSTQAPSPAVSDASHATSSSHTFKLLRSDRAFVSTWGFIEWHWFRVLCSSHLWRKYVVRGCLEWFRE